MTLLAELEKHLLLPVSNIVVTRGRDGRAHVTRAVVTRLDDGLVRVALGLPEADRVLSDIDDNGHVALTASYPLNYKTLQAKGRDARRLDWPGHADVAVKQLEAFVATIMKIGIHHHVAVNMISHRRFATIAFTPSEIFDQTPGAR